MLLFGSVVADASTATCIDVRVALKKTRGRNGGCSTHATLLAVPDKEGVPESHTVSVIVKFASDAYVWSSPGTVRFPDQNPSPHVQLYATIVRPMGLREPLPSTETVRVLLLIDWVN